MKTSRTVKILGTSILAAGLDAGWAQMVAPDPCSPLKTRNIGVIRGNGHDGPRNATFTNLQTLAQQVGFRITPDIDANTLTESNIAQYDILVFNYVFNLQQESIMRATAKAAFMKWLRLGKKGFVGYHTSGALEWSQSEWRNFQDSVTGMRYALHGTGTPQGTIEKTKDPAVSTHPIMKGLPDRFTGSDEWYEYQLDSKIYDPAWGWKIMYNLISVGAPRNPPPPNHPAAWFREDNLGTRFFYTTIIHTAEGANSDFFKSLLLRALEYTAGPTPNPPPAGCTPISIPSGGGSLGYKSGFSYVTATRELKVEWDREYRLSVWSPSGKRLYSVTGSGRNTFAPPAFRKPGLYIAKVEIPGMEYVQKVLIY